jgi:hypothetical protein
MPEEAPILATHPREVERRDLLRAARWVQLPHRPDDGHLHLLGPAEVVVTATGGHAHTLCGRFLPAEGLTLTHGCAGALGLTCLTATVAREERPHPRHTAQEAPGQPPGTTSPPTGGGSALSPPRGDTHHASSTTTTRL